MTNDEDMTELLSGFSISVRSEYLDIWEAGKAGSAICEVIATKAMRIQRDSENSMNYSFSYFVAVFQDGLLDYLRVKADMSAAVLLIITRIDIFITDDQFNIYTCVLYNHQNFNAFSLSTAH